MFSMRIASGLMLALVLFASEAWASQTLNGQVEGTATDQQPMSAPYSATDNNQDGLPESISIPGGQIDDGTGNFVGSITLQQNQEIERQVRINGRVMAVVIYVGTAGANVRDCRTYTHPVIFFGGGGADQFRGGPDGDSAYMGDGNDQMQGNGGDDEAWGGDGDDNMGTDSQWGGDDPGDDSYTGGTGNDDIGGGTGADTLDDSGESAPDTDHLHGGGGGDTMNADDADSNDTVDCGDNDAAADTVTCDQSDTVQNANSGGVTDSITRN